MVLIFVSKLKVVSGACLFPSDRYKNITLIIIGVEFKFIHDT